MKLVVKRLFDDVKMPEKAHGAESKNSGFDLFNYRFVGLYNMRGYSDLTGTERSTISLAPNDRIVIGTGLKARVDTSRTSWDAFCSMNDVTWELQVRSRGGTATKRGLAITLGVGTVDNNYSGEIFVVVNNTSPQTQDVELGERLAQLVPCLVGLPTIVEGTVGAVDSRGDGTIE